MKREKKYRSGKKRAIERKLCITKKYNKKKYERIVTE